MNPAPLRAVIEVSSIRKSLGRFRRAVKTRAGQGEFISFENLDTLLKTLTSKCWELLRALQGREPMSIRALARELDRDVKNVHTDIQTLSVPSFESRLAGGMAEFHGGNRALSAVIRSLIKDSVYRVFVVSTLTSRAARGASDDTIESGLTAKCYRV